MATEVYTQQNQPPGVPPLQLTGERTLPAVPAENYWYRRHLVVYEWIARRVWGQRVIDLACGEGYGSNVLARRAASVVGVDANPEAHDHARLRYRRENLRFERALIEEYGDPGSCDAIVFLQTVEHVRDPAEVLRHLRELLVPGGTAYISTPNVLTLAPRGASHSGNPWHVKEYRHDEFLALCQGVFPSVVILGLHHTRKLRLHELALRLGWDRLHRLLGITGRFYDWFIPAISVEDFALRARDPDRALDFLAVCSRT
jgi:2-polyprenyl-3-methyl-5-hydroxy-6-metoxy-1,4-benzoquinol methylase